MEEGTSRLARSGSPMSTPPGVLAPGPQGSTCQTFLAGLPGFGSRLPSDISSPLTCPAVRVPSPSIGEQWSSTPKSKSRGGLSPDPGASSGISSLPLPGTSPQWLAILHGPSAKSPPERQFQPPLPPPAISGVLQGLQGGSIHTCWGFPLLLHLHSLP